MEARSRAILNCCSIGKCIIIVCLFASASLSSSFSSSTPKGVAIFDTLFISANSVIGIHGDLYLHKAHVLGEGAIRLQGDSSQHIISDKSQVNNLHLANPDRVILKGDLLISGSLKVEKGVFDVRGGNLMFSDSAQVQLPESIIMYAHAIITANSSTPLNPSFSDFTLEGILLSAFDLRHNRYWTESLRYSELAQYSLQITLKVETLPPKLA